MGSLGLIFRGHLLIQNLQNTQYKKHGYGPSHSGLTIFSGFILQRGHTNVCIEQERRYLDRCLIENKLNYPRVTALLLYLDGKRHMVNERHEGC